ncbi:MAG TPA: tetratricopeptide repeat protein [Candidatus Limnocylindria bacterium]|nr:tetratricopeptide repeat protein [Candidatus Limnocylindria bacterium]
MDARPLVAVVPFGAPGAGEEAGAVARQLARRVVERSASESALELRPVLLVALPERGDAPGYLVMGATPDAALAARYGASLGATHALTGVLAEARLDLRLVQVEGARAVAERALEVGHGALPDVEREILAWLAHALGVEVANAEPVAGDEEAYRRYLLGLDEEVNAALFSREPERAREAARRAREHHLAALAHDASYFEPERRLLTLAAASVEAGEEHEHVGSLEALIERVPRSWRAHYLLGELRQATGDVSGAIVAFEHANSLEPLRDPDRVRLAELYLRAGQAGMAAAHLRAVGGASPARAKADEVAGLLGMVRGAQRLDVARAAIAAGRAGDALGELDALASGTGAVAAQARRLRLGVRHPERERDLERAGAVAVGGDVSVAAEAREAFARVLEAEPDLWEAHFGLGLLARHEGRAREAERAFRRVLELWPDQPDALHELGVALLLADERAEAVTVLDEAARHRPDDAGYLADAGFAHLRSGDLAGARERLERARSMDDSDAITRAYLEELERVEAGGR